MRPLTLGVVIGSLSLVSCATSSNPAFPTAKVVAEKSGNDIATLSRGRVLYTTRCTECHVARPITKFSAGQWRVLVERMAPRARLNAADQVAVESYLVAGSSTQ